MDCASDKETENMAKWDFPPVTQKMVDGVNKEVEKGNMLMRLKEGLGKGNEARKESLANYLECDLEDLEDGYRDEVFEYGNEEWIVLTEEEAYEEAGEQIRDIYDDIGLDSFTDSFKDWIVNNAIDEEEIHNWMEDSYRSYVDDIENENDNTYGNRLIQELHDEGILSDDDFEVDEDGETIYDTLKDDVDLESKKDEYVERLAGSITPLEFLKEMYSDKEIGEILEENGMIDMDEVIDECIREDGVAHFISSYDGNEIDLGNGLYAYRLN